MKTRLRTLIPVVSGWCCLSSALFAQDFDIKLLDKLGATSRRSTNVTLSGDMLKLASGFLGNDDDKDAVAIKSLVANLKAIYVRAYEFDKPGQYSENDLAPIRTALKQPGWTAVVDIKEEKETTQVYFMVKANGKLGGVAVVSTEPEEFTVVYVDGELNPSDVAKLSGSMGIPDLRHLVDNKIDVKVNVKGDNKGVQGNNRKDRKTGK